MPRFLPLPTPLADPVLGLRALLESVHEQLRRIEPSIGRISFLIHDPLQGSLRTYLCDDLCDDVVDPQRCFEERSLNALPALLALQQGRQVRVIDDLARPGELASPHDRWLLEQGWRSSLSHPLLRRGVLLGFLFVNASLPDAFRPERLVLLEPLLELLLLRIGDHLGGVADLHATLALVAEMVMLRDPATGGHLRRVAGYCGLIASALEHVWPLPAGYGALLASFAPLHDVGKVGIPDRILLKPAGLDPEEQRIMRSHVVLGMALIERVLEGLHLSEEPAVQVLREVVAHHHEYLDGSGYPRGLQGEAVSLAGRIVAVADIYDSLTQERPYKTALADAEALAILWGMVEAGKLDGRCLEALERCGEERAAICGSAGGGGAAAER